MYAALVHRSYLTSKRWRSVYIRNLSGTASVEFIHTRLKALLQGFETGVFFVPKPPYDPTKKLMKGGDCYVIPRQSIQCANGSKEHRS